MLQTSSRAGHSSSCFNIPVVNHSGACYEQVGCGTNSNYIPKPGDLFFTKSWSHVGLVYYVDGDYFYTIEGNSNNTGSTEGTKVCSNRRYIRDYYFGVPEYTKSYSSIPDPVLTLRSNKKVYNSGESIRFEWDPVYGAEEYWVYLWKDGVQLFSHNCGNNTSFTQAPSSSGKYTLIIRPGNSNGFNDSSIPCCFVVGKYDINYNANGGIGAPSSQIKTHGKDLTLSTTKPTRTGYTFVGWATSSSATTAQYSAGSIYTNEASVTLYAVWRKQTFTITYNANGGANAPGAQTQTYGTAITVTSQKPEKTYTVTFNANGGTIHGAS